MCGYPEQIDLSWMVKKFPQQVSIKAQRYSILQNKVYKLAGKPMRDSEIDVKAGNNGVFNLNTPSVIECWKKLIGIIKHKYISIKSIMDNEM